MVKKGFTLIELLGVIIILGIISLIVTPTINKVLKNAKEKLYQSQVKLIEESAKKWVIENVNEISETETVHLNLSELINSGYIEQTELKDPRNTNNTMNGCIIIQYNNEYSKYEYSYDEKTCYEIDPIYANKPALTTGMIPVKWYNGNWVKADSNNIAGDNQWYDYNSQMWANSVTVTSTNRETYLSAEVGTIISISDINTMWVWIPRYKYAIPANTGTLERSINIVFESKTTTKSTGNAVDTNYKTHPAFTFGTTEVNGIWVGKFETTGTIDIPTILPNMPSLKEQTIKAMYDSSRKMENNTTYGFSIDGNIHMAKDSEWGAVTYLSHSIYGENNQIFINPSSSYITGRGGTEASQGSTADASSTASSALYGYDGKDCSTKTGYLCTGTSQSVYGMASSTTGNIYGVYDMSGGSWEYVMGMYRPTDSTSVTDNSGFGATISLGNLPESKYWNQYTTTTIEDACNGGICYGSAFSETSYWYYDFTAFVTTSNPWSVRGGADHSYYAAAGAFVYGSYPGNSTVTNSYRIVQLKI